MRAYCKSCDREHSAWNRLNDGMICGLCGTRERDPQVKPVRAHDTGRLDHLRSNSERP